MGDKWRIYRRGKKQFYERCFFTSTGGVIPLRIRLPDNFDVKKDPISLPRSLRHLFFLHDRDYKLFKKIKK